MTDLKPGKTYIREIHWGPLSGIYSIKVKRIYKMNRGSWWRPLRITMVECSGTVIRSVGGIRSVNTPVEFTDNIPASAIRMPQTGGSRYRVKYSKKRSKRRSTKRKSTKRRSTKRRSKQRKYKKTRRRK